MNISRSSSIVKRFQFIIRKRSKNQVNTQPHKMFPLWEKSIALWQQCVSVFRGCCYPRVLSGSCNAFQKKSDQTVSGISKVDFFRGELRWFFFWGVRGRRSIVRGTRFALPSPQPTVASGNRTGFTKPSQYCGSTQPFLPREKYSRPGK